MARLRRDGPDMQPISPVRRPLRIVASGTLFVTHTLSLPVHPTPSSVTRAHSVEKTRGGSASTLLSLLSQFPSVDAMLVASLGGNAEGKMILRDLEREGVNTRFCKIWDEYGVPSAWVLHADNDTKTVINHNPLPDVTHEEFVSLLGPLLAPENYYYPSPSASPTAIATFAQQPVSPHLSSQSPSQARLSVNSPAPFDWIHVEGRSVKTTLNNVMGLDGLARERKWRSHCVFSVDVGRRGRQGVEALIPHADVIFLNKHYAQAHSPHYATTPRAFLLSLTQIAPSHALLVAHWGSEGAAVLSLPTREYFQSSGWVEEASSTAKESTNGHTNETQSVRSGSSYWATPGGRTHTPSSSGAFTSGGFSGESSLNHSSQPRPQMARRGNSNRDRDDDDDDNDSQETETPRDEEEAENEVLDEVGAQDAFVAGMIYALSRKIMPGPPYTPMSASTNESMSSILVADERQRWRLDECLRFATELSGRKARRKNWDGLADEMIRAGWFE